MIVCGGEWECVVVDGDEAVVVLQCVVCVLGGAGLKPVFCGWMPRMHACVVYGFKVWYCWQCLGHWSCFMIALIVDFYMQSLVTCVLVSV